MGGLNEVCPRKYTNNMHIDIWVALQNLYTGSLISPQASVSISLKTYCLFIIFINPTICAWSCLIALKYNGWLATLLPPVRMSNFKAIQLFHLPNPALWLCYVVSGLGFVTDHHILEYCASLQAHIMHTHLRHVAYVHVHRIKKTFQLTCSSENYSVSIKFEMQYLVNQMS